MQTVPILFTFDKSLELAAGVCMTSLLENASPDTFYDIFVLHSDKLDFSDSPLFGLMEKYPNCRLRFRPVSNAFVGAYEVRGITETTYYRLISPELITEYDRIIYSDVDVIFREDLAKYYTLDLGNHLFAGTDNLLCRLMKEDSYASKVLGLDYRKGYYYAGNLVINLALIRKEGLTRTFRELAAGNKFLFQDMDILNIACNGRILDIGPRFCVSVRLYELMVNRRDWMVEIYGEDAITEALTSGIVHYNGAKPWDGIVANADIWWRYYRQSIFFDENFAYAFWTAQRDSLTCMPLVKRIKLLLRYPLDLRLRKK